MPQGSILGPTLFLIFINDLPLHIKKCSSDLYADDTTIHTHGNDIDAIEEDLQGEFGNTKTWGKINKMNVHMTKTICMLVGARKRLNHSRPLNIIADDVNIQSVSKQKLLGVYIDEHLSWSAHIDHLCSLISSKISLLRQLATYVPNIFKKFTIRGIFFLILITALLPGGQPLQLILNAYPNCKKRAARIILRADYDTPSCSVSWDGCQFRTDLNIIRLS